MAHIEIHKVPAELRQLVDGFISRLNDAGHTAEVHQLAPEESPWAARPAQEHTGSLGQPHAQPAAAVDAPPVPPAPPAEPEHVPGSDPEPEQAAYQAPVASASQQ